MHQLVNKDFDKPQMFTQQYCSGWTGSVCHYLAWCLFGCQCVRSVQHWKIFAHITPPAANKSCFTVQALNVTLKSLTYLLRCRDIPVSMLSPASGYPVSSGRGGCKAVLYRRVLVSHRRGDCQIILWRGVLVSQRRGGCKIILWKGALVSHRRGGFKIILWKGFLVSHRRGGCKMILWRIVCVSHRPGGCK